MRLPSGRLSADLGGSDVLTHIKPYGKLVSLQIHDRARPFAQTAQSFVGLTVDLTLLSTNMLRSIFHRGRRWACPNA
jgi:hypothetical protein